MTIDDNVASPYRDRIYVTWTDFAADGSAYIYETHSNDYGESFSARVLVSADSAYCTNTFGAGLPTDRCNENQFSDPFVGPDGNLYVAWNNFNNQATSGTDNHYQVLLAKSTDGGQTFSAPVKVSDYYDLPDCDTYQGAGADPGRSCVPEKSSTTRSVFRATNYPSGQVDPKNANVVAVTFGSYINRYSNESNGCTPTGFAADGNPTYTGVKTAGACSNKILLSVSTDGGATFTGTRGSAAAQLVVTQRPVRTDRPVLAVGRVHAVGHAGGRLLRPPVRQRRDDGLLGLQPVGLKRSRQLRPVPRDVELDAGPDGVRGPGRRPVLRRLRVADGVRQGVSDLV